MTGKESYRHYKKIAIANGVPEQSYKMRVYHGWPNERAAYTPPQNSHACNQCEQRKRTIGSLLCNKCQSKQFERLKQNRRDVETGWEDDLTYTLRKLDEKGAKYKRPLIATALKYGVDPEIIIKNGGA